MTDKQEVLRQIAEMIAQNGVTLDEVTDAVNHLPILEQFDVAVVKDGFNLRVPFSKRDKMEVIGIFPFKDCDYYLNLSEINYKTRAQASKEAKDNEAIPPIWFWQKVANISTSLNNALKQLDALPISGTYFATKQGDAFANRENIVATFDGVNPNCELIRLPSHVPLRVRYVGKITP